MCENFTPQKTQKICSPDNKVAKILFTVVYLVYTQQWISWIDIITPEICFIYRPQIPHATIKTTTHSNKND